MSNPEKIAARRDPNEIADYLRRAYDVPDCICDVIRTRGRVPDMSKRQRYLHAYIGIQILMQERNWPTRPRAITDAGRCFGLFENEAKNASRDTHGHSCSTLHDMDSEAEEELRELVRQELDKAGLVIPPTDD